MVLLALAGCASGHADVGEQVRRIQAQEEEERRARGREGADPIAAEPLRSRLESEIAVLEARLTDAERASSMEEVAAASAALDRLRRQLAAEVDRQRKLADLRARTPKRLIRLDSGTPASSPAEASTPRAESAPTAPRKTWFSEGTRTRPAAPLPTATHPAGAAVESQGSASELQREEFDSLDRRIRWLADLRTSAGDRAGASRLKRELVKWTHVFRTGDPARALTELRALERSADH